VADQKTEDLQALQEALKNLLQGELKVGLNLLKLSGPLKREATNRRWVVAGLRDWLEETEEAVPVLASALGEAGVERLRAWLTKGPA